VDEGTPGLDCGVGIDLTSSDVLKVRVKGKMMGKMTVDLPREKVAEFCRRNHIRRLSLFGSALRGELRQDSDIDFLVEFDPNHIPGLIKLAGMELELSGLLGRRVDLRTAQDLSRYFREDVCRSAKVQYAEISGGPGQ
jgi:predicted nucleotidyltransferase